MGVTHDYAARDVDMEIKLNQLKPGGAAVDCNILQVLERLGGFGKDHRAAIFPRQASHHQRRAILFKGGHVVVQRLKTILDGDSECRELLFRGGGLRV